MKTKTPELEKQRVVQERSQAIGQFVEGFLRGKGIVLAKWGENRNYPSPLQYNIEALLAEFFDIDLKKIEKERLSLLEEIRSKPS